MNRRETIKALMAASGGLIALPSWAESWTTADLLGFQSTFSATEQELLTSVADTIIPAGDAIGAISVGVDKFLEKLFDKCYDAEIQTNIKNQLAGLDKSAQGAFGKSFPALDQIQRQDLLLKLSASDDKNQKDFFTLIKSETIRGFNTSREVMVDYLKYKMVPGHYYGCVDVKA